MKELKERVQKVLVILLMVLIIVSLFEEATAEVVVRDYTYEGGMVAYYENFSISQKEAKQAMLKYCGTWLKDVTRYYETLGVLDFKIKLEKGDCK